MSSPGSSAQRVHRSYHPAVGPRLRKLLYVVFALAALLGANGAYLAAVTAMESLSGEVYQNWFYQIMFLVHLVLGLLLLVPFIVFLALHLKKTVHRRNRRAVRVGFALMFVSLVLLISGVLLVRISGVFDLRHPAARGIVYWAHVGAPFVCVWLYWLHRLAGRKIQYRLGLAYLVGVAVLAGGMVLLHSHDPREWNRVGPAAGEQYFAPSLARTATGDFIPAKSLMMDDYCRECHADVHQQWTQSAHHFSSFNNPAYLASVRETRKHVLQRDKSVQASRWCAGCHDPVPFFSGAFDDPDFDDVGHPTAHAGITCTSCHAITNINSVRGNGDYTIEEPEHYPFAFSKNPVLKWMNRQLIKAKPSLHKKTFLKPFHKTAEFCSVCHKVNLPEELTDYAAFVRGQNHYDSHLLSGVSGHSARSFYYPEYAHQNCNTCHMPATPSTDFGARPLFHGKQPLAEGQLAVHNHLFPGGNTAIPWMVGHHEALRPQSEILKNSLRIDLFGLREGGEIDGKLLAPLRPERPPLRPGETYLLEVVLRTLTLGHHFTQGTVDSNQVWVELIVRDATGVIGQTGQIDSQGKVDPYAHFVNAFVIDRNGHRIARRNAEDIFVKLYDHQIPPGAAASLHYRFKVPESVTGPLTVTARLRYRKFDTEYYQFIRESLQDTSIPHDDPSSANPLPIVDIASDQVTLPLTDQQMTSELKQQFASDPEPPILWQRWNDYGIGLLLKGRAELRQAEDAFKKVEKLGRYDGPVNLARVYQSEGRVDEATEAVQRAATFREPAAPDWTLKWLSALLARQQGQLEQAEENLTRILDQPTPAAVERGFDFSRDYQLINLLGQTLYDRAKQIWSPERKSDRDALMQQAITRFKKTLQLDPENVEALYSLSLIYRQLGDAEQAEKYAQQHAKTKPDDNARDQAVRLARERYPAANRAAEAVTIYDLQRRGGEESADE